MRRQRQITEQEGCAWKRAVLRGWDWDITAHPTFVWQETCVFWPHFENGGGAGVGSIPHAPHPLPPPLWTARWQPADTWQEHCGSRYSNNLVQKLKFSFFTHRFRPQTALPPRKSHLAVLPSRICCRSGKSPAQTKDRSQTAPSSSTADQFIPRQLLPHKTKKLEQN